MGMYSSVPKADPAVYWHRSVDDVVGHSTAFVDSLDRSVLGSLGVPRDVLILLDINERAGSLRMVADIHILQLTERKTYDDAYRAYVAAGGEPTFESFDYAVGELLWWWSVTDDPMWKDNWYARGVGGWIEDALSRVRLIAARQDMHPFFEVGIWNTDFIERCIADDIDSELAQTMVSKGAK